MFSLKKSKCVYYVLFVISIFLLVGCASEKKAKSQSKKQVNIVDKTNKLLVNSEWKHYDSNLGENLCISFYKNGEFYYHCECGEPVGDSDCYDIYKYKKGGKLKICMSNEKNKSKDIKIFYIDDKTLLIGLDGEVTEFYNAKKVDNKLIHTYMYGCEKCNVPIEKYSGFNTIVSIDKDTKEMTIGPCDYDKEIEEQKVYLRDVKQAKDVEVYKIDINSENDDAGNLKKHKCSYKKVDDKDIEEMIEKFSRYALINYNKEGKVVKVIFYKEKLKDNM